MRLLLRQPRHGDKPPIHGGRALLRTARKIETCHSRDEALRLVIKMARKFPFSRFPVTVGAALLTVLILSLNPSFAADMSIPPTPKEPVSDMYHGVKVSEDYRWLESGDDPAVKKWTAQQNARTRAWLDELPDRARIEQQLTELFAKMSPSYGWLSSRPGRLFALKFDPDKQQRLLVTLDSPQNLGSERVVVDPNEMEPKGAVSIDWYVPSADGKQVAVCLSQNGSEEGALHLFDLESGKELPDRIERVQYPTGGGSAAWSKDGKIIYYTRYPRKGERPEADLNFYQQVYVHRVGTPESDDQYSIGKDFPRIAEVELETTEDGKWLIASVANGDGGEFAHYLRNLAKGDAAEWVQVTHFDDGVKAVAPSPDGRFLYLRSVKDAPRGKVLRMVLDPLGDVAEAKTIIREGDAVVEGITATHHYVYVTELLGGPSRIRRFNLDGSKAVELPLPPNSGAGYVLALEDQPETDRVLFREASFVEPDAWVIYDPAANGGLGALEKTALVKQSPVSFDDIEVVREFAESKDGTKVPVNILKPKGLVLDGSNPTLLTAYGGYGISLRPEYDFTRRLWFDRGGVIAIANLRGGGEYGEAWHLAGNLTRKQNVFDDFAGCAEHLIKRGYTNPKKLAIEGGSNGGLLMGAMLTQHPELIRAVVSHVGIYDMLRVELDPNGAFNVTEFGTVKDPDQFKALLAYSPYHHVAEGGDYPSVFLLAGEHDGRVNPAHSRKMTARLQAAMGADRPVLLRMSGASGHGMGTALSERIAQEADVFAFLFAELGMASSSPPAK